MVKLDYFDCISPLPLVLQNVGSVISPKLSDVAKISYYVYAQYVSALRMTPEDFYDKQLKEKEVDFEYVFTSTKFDLILYNEQFREIITAALNFFFLEHFEFYPEYRAFLLTEKDSGGDLKVKGVIDQNNYADVVDIILQRIHITPDETEVDDISKVKNKLGLKIYEKIMKGRKRMRKAKSNDPDLTLPNIIAATAAKSLSLNWNTIWDITVFQLFDIFERLQIIDSYEIASSQVATWGDKDNKFKFGQWMSNIYDKNRDAS